MLFVAPAALFPFFPALVLLLPWLLLILLLILLLHLLLLLLFHLLSWSLSRPSSSSRLAAGRPASGASCRGGIPGEVVGLAGQDWGPSWQVSAVMTGPGVT